MKKLSLKYLMHGCAFIAFCGGAQAETFNSSLEYALQNHPAIMASKAVEQAAFATINEEKSALYPTASLGASFGRLYSDSTTTRGLSVSRGVGYSWFGEGTARINQTLYDWSATDNTINAAQSRYQGANVNTQSQAMAIELQTAQAYLQLLRASRLLDLAKDNQGDMQDYMERIQISFDNGGADESQVSRAQDLVSMAKNAVIQYESEYQIANASYKEVVGRLPDGEIDEPTVDLSILPKALEDSIAMALSLNPQLESIEMDIKANQYDLKSEKANINPIFDAELSALKKDQRDLVGGEVEDVRGMVSANWNYAFGGAQKAAQDRAAFLVKESEFNREALKRTIERDVEVAWASLRVAQQQKNNEADRLIAAQKTLETYQEQYEGGQQKLLDVMTVTNAAFLTESDYLNIKYQEMNAAYTMMNIIGLSLLNQEVTSDDAIQG